MTPQDPTRDPASEDRDDWAVNEDFEKEFREVDDLIDSRDPSKEDREPQFIVPPNPPEECLPIPEGFIFYGRGPLETCAVEPTTDIIGWDPTHQKWSSDYPLTGSSNDNLYALRKDSPIYKVNFFNNLKLGE